MIPILLTVIAYGLIFWLFWWAIGAIGIPEPFHKVAIVILVIASILVILGLLDGSVHTFPIFNSLSL